MIFCSWCNVFGVHTWTYRINRYVNFCLFVCLFGVFVCLFVWFGFVCFFVCLFGFFVCFLFVFLFLFVCFLYVCFCLFVCCSGNLFENCSMVCYRHQCRRESRYIYPDEIVLIHCELCKCVYCLQQVCQNLVICVSFSKNQYHVYNYKI